MNLSQNVSTKGKIFNTPWDPARPAVGSEVPWPAHQRRALTLLQSCPDRDSHLPSAVPCAAHAVPCSGDVSLLCCTCGQGHVPFWSPCACPVCCSWWAPSMPLSLGCLAAPLGRGAAGETSTSFMFLHALFAVISGETGVYVCLLEGGARPRLGVSGSGAVCPPPSFAVALLWGQWGKTSLGGSWAALPGVGSAGSLQPPPSSHLHPKTLGAEAAPHSKLAQFLAQEAGE